MAFCDLTNTNSLKSYCMFYNIFILHEHKTSWSLIRSRGCNVGSSCFCEERDEWERDEWDKWRESIQDVNWPVHWDWPEALHVLIQLWHVCFHHVRAWAMHPSFCVRYVSYIYQGFTHQGCSGSLLARVTAGLSLKGWDPSDFSAFCTIPASILLSIYHSLMCVITLRGISVWSDTSWLEENNLQSKIVKLKLSLTCLHTGNYVGLLVCPTGSITFYLNPHFLCHFRLQCKANCFPSLKYHINIPISKVPGFYIRERLDL